ncbi:uncharacterized protein LOC112573660 [Pomacea canaliculata]|uniref:uncharacterized protein LOC112573660 n=1 Tax=Pomacea canaliculata TaxID=400727 RepID=UPI000D72B653|nr:uncharacterized protein LOC112573660 [Pomacea canaliculata]
MKTDVKDVKNRLAQMECQTQEKELTSDTRVTVSLKIFRGCRMSQVGFKDRSRKTCTLELARCYNYNGLKGKKGLKNHPFILRTVQDAARKSYPDATEVELQVQISKWLTGARDRENGRKERLLKPINNSGVEGELQEN